MDTTMNYGNQGGYQGSSGLQMTYTVDIVFCIDSTGSMQPVLDTVKNSAIHFYDDLMRIMTSVGKKVDSVRVKIISFRDYIADGENARRFKASDFPRLPGNIVLGTDMDGSVKASLLDGAGSSRSALPVVGVIDAGGDITFLSSGYMIGIGERLLRDFPDESGQ